LFGTGNADAVGMNGRQRVKASQSSARTAKARTGTSLDKTSALWRLDHDDQLASLGFSNRYLGGSQVNNGRGMTAYRDSGLRLHGQR
jgi:hypothetical protein